MDEVATTRFPEFQDQYNLLEEGTAIAAMRYANMCLTVAATLIVFCLIRYGVKTNRWRKRGADLNRGTVYTACVMAVALTIPRFLYVQFLFYLPLIPGAMGSCEIYMDLSSFGYYIAAGPTYFFLWLRQKAINSHPAIKKLVGSAPRIAGTVSFVVLVIISALIGIGYTVPLSYQAGPNGCMSIPFEDLTEDIHRFWFRMHPFVLLGGFLASQITLVSLFLYPMIKTVENHNRQ